MTRRMILMLVIVGLVFGGIFGFQIFKGVMIQRFFANRSEPAQTVATLIATSEDWYPTIHVVGGLRAENGTDISPEVGGLVAAVPFHSGEDIAKGAVLLHLRSDDDAARLNALKATADLARITLQRQRKLLNSGTIAQAALDNAEASLRAADAQVIEQQALIEKKTIRAPFAGRLGIRGVDIGQVIAAGTKVTTLQALDTLYFDFTLPQQSISNVTIGQAIDLTTDAFPGETITGTIAAIDAKADPDTRNVAVRAEVKNPGRKWLPGMYAKGSLRIGAPRHLVTVPQTAVSFNTFGETIYVIENGPPAADGSARLIARQKLIKAGDRRGDQVAILDGLGTGEQVVVAGALKLRNGSPVTVNNSVAMPNDPAPVVRDQ